MIVVPARKFMMGSPVNEKGRSPNEGSQHLITIASPFARSLFMVRSIRPERQPTRGYRRNRLAAND